MFLSDAGGVGLNLQRAASCCINLELPWNPAVLEQRIGRIYRLGQRQPIDVYNLVTEYGIEARIADLVASKKVLFTGLFDGTSDAVRFEGGKASFLSDVEKLVPEVPVFEPGAEDGAASEPSEDADSLDGPVQPVALLPAPELGAAIDAALDAKREIEAPGAETPPGTNPTSGAPESTPVDVASLLSSIRVERTAEGGLRIEAPPSAASSLASLFAGMARLMAMAQAST